MNSKPPTIPFGIVAGTFSENRSRKSFMQIKYPAGYFTRIPSFAYCYILFSIVIPITKTPLCFFFSPSHEHHLLPPGEKVLVVVSEKETSSIIAYTLRWVVNTGAVLKKHSLLKKREGDWNRNVPRNCFWDRYWGRAGQLLANFYFLSRK